MGLARGGSWAMVTKIYKYHNVSFILPILQKRSYYGWMNMMTSPKRKQQRFAPPQSYLANSVPTFVQHALPSKVLHIHSTSKVLPMNRAPQHLLSLWSFSVVFPTPNTPSFLWGQENGAFGGDIHLCRETKSFTP